MKNSIIIVIFSNFFLISVSSMVLPRLISGPNCHMCEVMINNVRYEYNNDFTNVTVDQMKNSLYIQCDLNFNGFTDAECKQMANQDAADVLQQLKEGKSSYRICQQENFC